MIDVLRQYQDQMTGLEILAITSYLVGQIIAVQDQRKITPEKAFELVQRNVAQGNRDVVDDFLGQTRGRA